MENLKKAENKNVESRGAKKRVGDAVRVASTFEIFIFAFFQENRILQSSCRIAIPLCDGL